MSNLANRLGARIRDVRHARQLSQEQLAERAGVSYKFLGEVERGQGNPTVKWLEAVARGLGVTIKDLIVEEESPPMTYPPLSGRDYSVVRDARDTLEQVLRRYRDAGIEPSAGAKGRRRPRVRQSGR